MDYNFKLGATFSLILSSNYLLAHSVTGDGFLQGLLHPVIGYDHFLAMLSVGIISILIGNKATWTIPLTFVLFVIIGTVMGINRFHFLYTEQLIQISVILLGIAIYINKKLFHLPTLCIVGFFAIFHGLAHGGEMRYITNKLFYATGFTIGTIVIHLLGLSLGFLSLKKNIIEKIINFFGGFIAGLGFQMIIN